MSEETGVTVDQLPVGESQPTDYVHFRRPGFGARSRDFRQTKEEFEKSSRDYTNSVLQGLSAGAPMFPSPEDGVAGTEEGDYFNVPGDLDSGVYQRLYEHVTGDAYLLISELRSTNVDWFEVNQRVVEFPQRESFVSGEIAGSYNPVTLAPFSSQWAVDDGKLLIAQTQDNGGARCWWAGHAQAQKAIDVHVAGEVTELNPNIGTSAAIIVFVGEGGPGMRGIMYSANGSLSVVNGAGTIQSGQVVSGGSQWAGQGLVSLDFTVREDGTGFAVAKSFDGSTLSLEFSGIPKGRVWLGWRAGHTGEIAEFSVRETDFIPQDNPNLNTATDRWNQVYSPGNSGSLGWQVLNNNGVLSSVTDGVDSWLRFTHSAASFAFWNQRLRAGQTELSYHTRIITSTLAGQLWLLWYTDANGNGITPATEISGARQTIMFPSVSTAPRLISGTLEVPEGAGRFVLALRTSPSGSTIEFDRVMVASDTSATYRPPVGTATPDLIASMQMQIDAAMQAAGVVTGNTGQLQSWRVLPNPPALPDRDPLGWTCTGLARITTGPFAGCFATGDDGRLVDTVSGTFAPAVHITDAEHSRVLATLPGDWDNSLQGVAWNTSNNTLLVATSNDRHVRAYDIYAAGSPEVLDDRISLASLSIPGSANGIALDPTKGERGHLYLGTTSDGVIYVIDYDTQSVLTTHTLSITPDQFHLMSDGARLLYTIGGNGNNGSVRCFNLATSADKLVCVLPGSQAIEGIYYDEQTGILYVINDGGYHVAARPQFNAVMRYRIPAIPA